MYSGIQYTKGVGGDLDSRVVSHLALNISMLCNALGSLSLGDAKLFLDRSPTSTLSSCFYLVYLN